MESAEYPADEALDAFARGDYARVLALAVPCAEAGNADAQTQLALHYECGLGVEREALKAEMWLLKATAQDNPLAWNNLGSLYACCHPQLEHRWGDATRCYQRAADLGLRVAAPYPPPACD